MRQHGARLALREHAELAAQVEQLLDLDGVACELALQLVPDDPLPSAAPPAASTSVKDTLEFVA